MAGQAIYAQKGSTERTLVIDFLEGDTLINFVDANGPLPESPGQEAQSIFRQMVAGLQHIHHKGPQGPRRAAKP